MNYSLNEINLLCYRASVGAGYSWGMAQEIARAVLWLHQHGINGCFTLGHQLSNFEAQKISHRNFEIIKTEWRSGDGDLCPISAGSYLLDMVFQLETSLKLKSLNTPLMILPFVAQLAAKNAQTINVGFSHQTWQTNGFKHSLFPPPQPNESIDLILENSETSSNSDILQEFTLYNRIECTKADWDGLAKFSNKTYAPATQASRILGAGAGLNDND